MKLYIDTTQPLKVFVRLNDLEIIKEVTRPQEQNILKTIDEALRNQKVNPSQLQSIEVNPGPGSFTGTRIGVSIANALAFALNVSINGQPPPIEPIYSQEPNITIPKK